MDQIAPIITATGGAVAAVLLAVAALVTAWRRVSPRESRDAIRQVEDEERGEGAQ
ncbi:MAG: hypothetical protein ACRCZP_02535 [Phycicoccus sp.]